MRIVIDNNVLVSAAVARRGRPAAVVAAWEAGRFDVASSEALLAELEDVVARPRFQRLIGWTAGERAAFVRRARLLSHLVLPTRTIDVCRDPADNRVLEAAVAGGADYIVTGDKDLLVLGAFEGIVIVSPAEFMDLLAES